MVELAQALIASGWLRSNIDGPAALSLLKPGDDLLPRLTEAAARSESTAPSQRRSDDLIRLLNWLHERGASLTFSWPTTDERPVDLWLGPRLLWWPQAVPVGRRVAWVSSRLGRAIDERPDWFAVLRAATAKLDPARDVLLTATGTTVDRFLDRAAILFGLRRLRVQLAERRSLVDWLTRLRRQLWRQCLAGQPASPQTDDANVWVSPIVDSQTTDKLASTLPLSDRVLIAAADQVFALQVRPNGNLHQLLRARLSDSAWPPASVWLALGEALVPADVAAELQSLGAVGWWLLVEHVSNVLTSSQGTGTLETCPTLTELPWTVGEYFVHWTRRRDGPWPDQSETDFIDDLLLRREASRHSAFATLSRIAQQRRLIASSSGIRGGAAVVSFSASTLEELSRRRTFRAHRGRWDCEAYGLCVRRDWLLARRAKPVIYGDDDRWLSLSNSERPFFQLQGTRERRGAKFLDWSQEAEWRVPHDLDLTDATHDDVVLFVPTEAEARQLAAISPWPVLAMPTFQNPSATPVTRPRC